MPDPASPLPGLFPYLVPKGADVPEGTLLCREYDGFASAAKAVIVIAPMSTTFPLFSQTPYRVAPPTEPGTILVNVVLDSGLEAERAYFLPASSGDKTPWAITRGGSIAAWVRTDGIASFTVATLA